VLTHQVWAVVVARTGPSAKSRLALALGPAQRAALARRMLRAVLEACLGADLGGTVVVTETPQGAALATELGAVALPDPSAGLNSAVSLGLDIVGQQAPGTAALVLPGDVPLVEAEDLRTIVAAAGDRPRVVVVVPDAAARGTNALLVRPPHLIEPSFGEPSFERHLAAARRAGDAIRLEVPRLAFDIDDEARLSMFAGRALHSQ
jgi:2-phospho-L-lactate/phosphoenolpyruvate guanylyltransferase